MSKPTTAAVSFGLPTAAEPELVEERKLVEPDNLRRIWGLGPKSEALLNAAGIALFEQLAKMTPAEIQRLLRESGIRVRYTSTWPEQARLLAAGEEDALAELQAQLGKHLMR
jgi:predicted flap endonuclease-1-like 5' DNA nuclease